MTSLAMTRQPRPGRGSVPAHSANCVRLCTCTSAVCYYHSVRSNNSRPAPVSKDAFKVRPSSRVAHNHCHQGCEVSGIYGQDNEAMCV